MGGASVSTPASASEDIDLSQIGPIYDRAQLRFRRGVIYVVFATGLCASLGGILAIFYAPHSTWDGRLILILGGAVVAGFGASSFGQLPRAAVRLRLDDVAVRMWTLKGELETMPWADPNLRLKVFNLPNTRGRERPAGLESVDFLVVARSKLYALLPGTALESLLNHASAQKVPVSEWTVDPLGVNRTLTIGQMKTA